jgi:uridine phosphorylase
MSIHRVARLALAMAFIGLGTTGCVMQRTVKNGDQVVSQGYVVKAPLVAP